MNKIHTSLPWALEDRTNKGEGFSIIATDVHYSSSGVAHYIRESDAKRILACVTACEGLADPSAVPELLKALVGLTKWANVAGCDREEGSVLDQNINAARAAIAKATGNA